MFHSGGPGVDGTYDISNAEHHYSRQGYITTLGGIRQGQEDESRDITPAAQGNEFRSLL
jgi:hypothetical protein